MKKAVPALVAVTALVALCVAFPPFHIRSLKAVRGAEASKQFNAAEFARTFWPEKLLPAATQAVEAGKVLDAIAANPKSVRDQFGRNVGVGNSYFLLLSGDARVVSADANLVELLLKPAGEEAQMVIQLGFVFGNAVRDATGLIKASDYPNAQEFNDISAALNSMVETNVLPQVQQLAQIGSRIHFVGCVEISDEDTDLKPLKLVPILVKPE